MKGKLKIIAVTIVVFLFFNLIGGLILGTAGQTSTDIFTGYLMFALYGLIFGLIIVFVDWILGIIKRR